MKDIEGYEGVYGVTEDGRVWSYPKRAGRGKGFIRLGRWLRPTNAQAYLLVVLCHRGRLDYRKPHRLVAEAFIPNPLKLPQVNHKNGVKTDNRVANLEWNTAKQNIRHAIDTGLRDITRTRGEGNPMAVLTEKIVREIRKRYEAGNVSQHILASEFGVSRSLIGMVAQRKVWAHIQ